MRIHEENLWLGGMNLGGMNYETPGDVRAKMPERRRGLAKTSTGSMRAP